MYAEKGNKVYTIDESLKEQYAKDGYDIKDAEGNVVIYGKGKTVPYERYAALEARCAELEKALEAKNAEAETPKEKTTKKKEAE